MLGFGKKIEIRQMDINEAYRRYESDPDKYVILCVDEVRDYDDVHIAGSECMPLRLMDQVEEYYPDKDLIYYVYALNALKSEKAYKIMYKKDYQVFDLGSFVNYREIEEGINAKKKRKRKRK